MSKKPNLFDIFGKILEDTIIKPARDILEPNKEKNKKSTPLFLIPKSEAVVFWDYENFPLPKDILPVFFFQTLFPSGKGLKILTKRVYGKSEIIAKKIDILQDFGFEYRRGPSTGKANEADHHLMLECQEFCNDSQKSLIVIIISGDIDYLPLISKLSSRGHEVRLICHDKKKIKPQLHRTVPTILDKNQIINSAKQLHMGLQKMSSLLDYMIKSHPENQITPASFIKEIEEESREERTKVLQGRLKLLSELPEFQERYNISSDTISLVSESKKIDEGSKIDIKVNNLLNELSSEPSVELWEGKWIQFIQFVPNLSDQEKYIKKMFRVSSIPVIRARLQNKLIEIVDNTPITEKTKVSIKDYFCVDCGMLQNSLKDLENHRKVAHNIVSSQTWTCDECKKKFLKQESLNQHKNMAHKDLISYECIKCTKKFDNDSSLQQHQLNKHNIAMIKKKEIPCPKCKQKFSSKESQRQHELKKHIREEKIK